MPTLHYILKDGSRRSVVAKVGSTVMDNAIRNDIRGIDAECGGCCTCATCHVYVDEAFRDRLPPPDEMEADMLGFVAAERRAGSRLGCQLVMSDALDGLTVGVPSTQA